MGLSLATGVLSVGCESQVAGYRCDQTDIGLVARADFQWLKKQYFTEESMRVSYEIIYRRLFIQSRGVLKKELMDYLRSNRHLRCSRHPSVHGHGRIIDAVQAFPSSE